MADRKSLAALFGATLGLAASRLADLALIGGAVATAAGAVGFAGYMTLAGAGKPNVFGMEYLAIFAQPSRGGESASNAKGLDMRPVGALPPAQRETGGYALVGARETYAWLREGDRIFAVRPGDDVPRLGRVAGIERRDGRWALIDGRGATLIVSPIAEDPPAGSREQRRMILTGRL